VTADERRSLRALIDRARRASVRRGDVERREHYLDAAIARRVDPSLPSPGDGPRRRRAREAAKRAKLEAAKKEPRTWYGWHCPWCGCRPRAGGVCREHLPVEAAWQNDQKGAT
jgi:hypothetical protein